MTIRVRPRGHASNHQRSLMATTARKMSAEPHDVADEHRAHHEAERDADRPAHEGGGQQEVGDHEDDRVARGERTGPTPDDGAHRDEHRRDRAGPGARDRRRCPSRRPDRRRARRGWGRSATAAPGRAARLRAAAIFVVVAAPGHPGDDDEGPHRQHDGEHGHDAQPAVEQPARRDRRPPASAPAPWPW